MSRLLVIPVAVLLAVGAWGQTAAERTPLGSDDGQQRAAELTRRGAQFLLAAQEQDGGWASQTGPGVTCLVLKALIQEPTVGPDHPAVRRGVELVRKSVHDDGGVYSAEGMLKNYESSVALSMFAALGKSRCAGDIATLQKFLKKHQWDEDDGKSIDDPWYGGAGYGRHERPDLSNTQMMLEALRDSGLPKDDPTYKKALVFISRCQMLGETNDQPLAKGSSQGGFIYTPANGGESKADTVEIDGRTELRCYGSMTYAGFKSMLYAGLERDDPRVKAAFDWIRRNWTLDHNPNTPGDRSLQGLYYSSTKLQHVTRWMEGLTTAYAMRPSRRPIRPRASRVGRERLHFDEDEAGRAHNWRQELVEKLAKLQRRDGSWVNEADRWMEGLPSLTTAYAMLSLQAAYPPAAETTSKPAP